MRAVLFDAVGTLFRARGTVGQIYGNVAARYAFQADPRAIDEEFVRSIKAQGIPIEKRSWKSLVRSVFAGLGPFPRFDEFFEEIYTVFATEEGWRCFPETVPVLQTLKQHRYRLGVVSNFDSRLQGVLEELGILSYFDTIVTPHTSGFAKPDRRIFLKASSALGVEPAETVFAGDDREQDFEAANRAGLRGIWVDRLDRASPESSRVEDLWGLLQLLEIIRLT